MKPHFEAVLTTRTTLFERFERGYGLPFSVGAEVRIDVVRRTDVREQEGRERTHYQLV